MSIRRSSIHTNCTLILCDSLPQRLQVLLLHAMPGACLYKNEHPNTAFWFALENAIVWRPNKRPQVTSGITGGGRGFNHSTVPVSHRTVHHVAHQQRRRSRNPPRNQ